MAPFLRYTARHETFTHTGHGTGIGDFRGSRPGAGKRRQHVPTQKLTAQETREVALDRLFASLHKASDEQAAKAVEEKIWELWSRFDSPTAEVLLGQAVVAMGASENAASLEILDRIVASYPTYAEAWNKRATLHFALGNYEASLRDIDKVLDLEPRHFGALAGRGMIYQRQENWTAALKPTGKR